MLVPVMDGVEVLQYLTIAVLAFVIGFGFGAVIFFRSRSAIKEEANHLRIKLVQSEASLRAEKEKTTWTEDAKTHFKDAFKVLANEELEANSQRLKETAKEQLGGVVDPLKQELTKLDTYVRELEGKREGAYSALDTQLQLLQGFQNSLKDQTTALVQALKSPTVRGRWGEIQLRRLVELAGMADHVDFEEQVSGESGRPDMIIQLSQGGILPIDAKVPLDAFLRAMETEDDQLRKQNMIQHAHALRERVQELCKKAYWAQFDRTPEVVVMFVPVEASLGAAFQNDPELFEYALSNKVLVSSPIVLFALLKAIAYGWQQTRIAENAAAIADQGRTLYDRMYTFIEHLTGMGKSLESCVKKYNDAVASLEGRLLPAAKRFLEMGVTTKPIEPPEHVDLQPRIPSVTDERKEPYTSSL